MKKLKMVCLTAVIASVNPCFAGGLLTNTNQNVAFNRMMSREASIGIDGVYFNPAGVAFLGDGHHLSLNLQSAYQTRTIQNDYKLFTNNTVNPTTPREFKGKAFAPVIPSLQYAYNKNRWSFQVNFALTGGGGKCTFDDGLGSFEKIVAETAMGACGLAGAIDKALGAEHLRTFGRDYVENHPAINAPMFTANQLFGKEGKYSYNSYMHGRQYYYGLSLAAAYRFNDHFSASVGVRGVYALCNYYGYVRDITVGNMPLYKVLDPSKPNAADIELSCDQSGFGVTPIIGVDFKTGRWNFSAKYEFKTRLRLKNKSVNQAPSIGNLPGNLSPTMVRMLTQRYIAAGMFSAQEVTAATEKAKETTAAVLHNSTPAMMGLKQQFDTKLNEAIGEYEDGKTVSGDIPALLTLGAGYKPIDALRINVGFHWFDDKHATTHNNRHKLLNRGTLEWSAGAEYDVNKKFTVSAGWQNTSYGMSEEYMDDKSFVVSSNSAAVGGMVHLSKKMDLNVAYFHTFYKHFKTSEKVELQPGKVLDYSSDYTRNNNVFAVGLDIHF